jgi:hypothetical protein
MGIERVWSHGLMEELFYAGVKMGLVLDEEQRAPEAGGNASQGGGGQNREEQFFQFGFVGWGEPNRRGISGPNFVANFVVNWCEGC